MVGVGFFADRLCERLALWLGSEAEQTSAKRKADWLQKDYNIHTAASHSAVWISLVC